MPLLRMFWAEEGRGRRREGMGRGRGRVELRRVKLRRVERVVATFGLVRAGPLISLLKLIRRPLGSRW